MESAAGSQNHCVYRNIPFDAAEEEVIQICEEIGPVVSFRLPLDRKTGRSKGYGFCEYRDEETALSACRNLEGCVINGHVLRFDILKYVKGADGKMGQKPSQAPVHQIPGLYQQPFARGQSHDYNHQLKLGTSFPILSPRSLQASSSQISHHSSTQIDHHALSPNLTKAGTPKQSTCSHFVVPYPSTPIMTPGISASPLLAESMSQEESPPTATTMPRTSASEQPVSRLIKAVQSLSPKSHRKAVSDITSIVSMVDRIPCSTPGNGSSSVDGEDGGDTLKKMKRYISVMPLNKVSSDGSINDNFMKFGSLDSSKMEATETSRVKRPKLEALQEEIREINQQLIDMVVSICDEDSESAAAAAAFEDGEGIIVICSFTAVAFSPSLKAHFASMHVAPVAPLRLLVPANYPESSPLLLDNLPVEPSEEFEDFYIKAKSRFSRSLRGLSEQISLGEMAAAWDACVRKVIVEYAQQAGGGSFSSVYGSWENCFGA